MCASIPTCRRGTTLSCPVVGSNTISAIVDQLELLENCQKISCRNSMLIHPFNFLACAKLACAEARKGRDSILRSTCLSSECVCSLAELTGNAKQWSRNTVLQRLHSNFIHMKLQQNIRCCLSSSSIVLDFSSC